MSERLVEAADQMTAEPGGERGSRLAEQLADAFQAEPVEQRLVLRGNAQRRDRQIGDGLGLAPAGTQPPSP